MALGNLEAQNRRVRNRSPSNQCGSHSLWNFRRQREMDIFFNKTEMSYFGSLSSEEFGRLLYQLFRYGSARGNADLTNVLQPVGFNVVVVVDKKSLSAVEASHSA